MLTIALIGLLGGLITGISPCVLPVLPVVFVSGGVRSADGSTVTPSRSRPYAIVAGLVVSFSAITLAGTLIVDALPVPKDIFRWAGLAALLVLAVATMVPRVEEWLQRPFARLGARQARGRRSGLALGLALGAVYVPCAGPVLAAITVAGATGHIGAQTLVLTATFAVGAGAPLLAFALAGRGIAERVRAFRRRERSVRIVAGVLVLALAVGLAFNVTDVFQRAVPDYTAALNNDLDHGGAQRRLAAPGGGLLPQCADNPQPGLVQCGRAPKITGITAWLNTPDGRAASTSGRVTLVDFWAYSCINCQRAIPHVEAWYRRYHHDGLQVIGVHTPEYAFEHVVSNVAAGARRLHITYPVAVDNDYDTWNAFHNEGWPAEYLIDASGRVRHVAIGEGGYSTTEVLVRQLLHDAHPRVALPPETDVPDTTPDDPYQTPETYLGAERAQAYDGGPLRPGAGRFTFPASLPRNRFALAGGWTVGDQALTAGDGARLELDLTARTVYLDVGGRGTVTTRCATHTTTVQISGVPDIHAVSRTPSAQRRQCTLSLTRGLQVYSFTFG